MNKNKNIIRIRNILGQYDNKIFKFFIILFSIIEITIGFILFFGIIGIFIVGLASGIFYLVNLIFNFLDINYVLGSFHLLCFIILSSSIIYFLIGTMKK